MEIEIRKENWNYLRSGLIKSENFLDFKKINVSLENDLSELDEIVVIGYGSQKLSDISGAISTVNNDAIESATPVRVEDALQGQASGVNIISSGSGFVVEAYGFQNFFILCALLGLPAIILSLMVWRKRSIFGFD